jgi:hypothetical protein
LSSLIGLSRLASLDVFACRGSLRSRIGFGVRVRSGSIVLVFKNVFAQS